MNWGIFATIVGTGIATMVPILWGNEKSRQEGIAAHANIGSNIQALSARIDGLNTRIDRLDGRDRKRAATGAVAALMD